MQVDWRWGGESSSEVPLSGTGDQQVCVCGCERRCVGKRFSVVGMSGKNSFFLFSSSQFFARGVLEVCSGVLEVCSGVLEVCLGVLECSILCWMCARAVLEVCSRGVLIV